MEVIKTLENIDFKTIYQAFNEAFADYDVPEMSYEQLLQMVTRRGYDPKISFGAFMDDRLVSFTLNGLGMWNGKTTAYDTGTGTVKEYRGKGLAKRIFQFAVPILKENGIEQYLLEVMQHNTKAVNLYSNQGFEVSREFDYYVSEKSKILLNDKKLNPYVELRELSLNDFSEPAAFLNHQHSWQNSFDSIHRGINHFKAIGAYKNGKLIGYGITELNSGDITQLAVDSKERRKGIATGLLKALFEIIPGNSVKVINTIKTDESTKQFLNSFGWEACGSQYEMILSL
ncbi:MAG: GNAT family N-acetyltransferase [Marinifilum sp.]|jgi:ribosomal protein S18 acetylase RimI-like enzyme|nr:GNAT family N-acetyltransferase [Marinifilum sp.]